MQILRKNRNFLGLGNGFYPAAVGEDGLLDGVEELGDGGGGHAEAAGSFLHAGCILGRPEEEEAAIARAGGGAPVGLEPFEEALFRRLGGLFS